MRDYLDWNATTPLRPEAKAAMVAAMEIAGNPSSVHSEGRAAKMAMERAREEIAAALGAEGADVIFTSGTTEAAAMVLAGQGVHCAPVEHSAVKAWCEEDLGVDHDGIVTVTDPSRATLQLANNETGVIQSLPPGLASSDLTQAFGKVPFAFNWLDLTAGFVSAHKLGGPKGIGALILKKGTEIEARMRGGGQEQGRRGGTENLIGILGFAAAAKAAQQDLDAGLWAEVEARRDALEARLLDIAPGAVIAGKAAPRLPNTTCILTSGWKGETQVMQMDLAGFAISAGSACSSGKIRASGTLQAMGFDDRAAQSAIRISISPALGDDQMNRFADAWESAYARWRDRNGRE
ncbi:MAG TPA: aminotransferase class V-fold PLP-dependent enzyme [Paracoccus sp. (in: a-proteobacteria)]|uniref:cysteine desulfurase family protein n=1 Tax=uncultured Paracoccus sp. TaxID=189685 RepID=UPI00260E9A8C|nr:aminotransferase class V-fold PLP-dependent enzyme [uncultured Paracoccus sp.]HMQ41922.1 aminotransferase class V-fold PLP-dependent enzyme [Paracoccus sp. (in: a-proteobacteria)]HMR37225.1 aminotransferase class V-fold PLP-dependent enzyme [Paracoccus sp. (in: a-proteobacteria)]